MLGGAGYSIARRLNVTVSSSAPISFVCLMDSVTTYEPGPGTDHGTLKVAVSLALVEQLVVTVVRFGFLQLLLVSNGSPTAAPNRLTPSTNMFSTCRFLNSSPVWETVTLSDAA